MRSKRQFNAFIDPFTLTFMLSRSFPHSLGAFLYYAQDNITSIECLP